MARYFEAEQQRTRRRHLGGSMGAYPGLKVKVEDFSRIEQDLSIPTQEILKVLPSLQESELAWELSVHLLNSQSINANFYGAHTLHAKISRHWAGFKDDDERREQIKQFLLRKLFESLQSLENRNIVTIKLFAAEYSNGWVTFIDDILQAIDLAFPNQVERAELAKLQFLTLLSEEFESPRMAFAHRGNLALYVGVDGRNIALRFIDRYTAINDGPTNPDLEKLREKGLQCLRNWVQFGVPALEIPQITDRLIQNFLWQGSHELCADVLHELLHHRNTVQVQNTVYLKLFQWMVSMEMQNQVQSSIQTEDLSLARSLIRVYASFGEIFYSRLLDDLSKTIMSNSHDGTTLPEMLYLEMVLALTNFPGHFPTDQNITETSLEFWHCFQEGVLEHLESGKQTAGLDQLLRPVITGLVTVIHSKVMFPRTEEEQNWDQDELNAFRIYRRDAGDILSDALYILKDPYPIYYIDLAMENVTGLAQNQQQQDQWQTLEATFFLLRKLSSMTLSDSLTPRIIRLFGMEYIGRVLDINLTSAYPCFQNKRLKVQALMMCGDFAKFYKSDQKVLSSLTHQIVCAFSDPELKAPATSTFRDICESASHELTFSVEAMIRTITSLQNHLDPPEMQRMMESVACIITSADGTDDLIPARMEAMTEFIIQSQEQLIMSIKQNVCSPADENVLEKTISNFKCLTACCTGARAGSKVIDVEVDAYPTPAPIPYTERVFVITSHSLEVLGMHEPVAHAISSFIIEGLRSLDILSPFSFPLGPLARLLSASYQSHRLSAYLDTIKQAVQTYSIRIPSPDNADHMMILNQLRDLAYTSIDLTMQSLSNPSDSAHHATIQFGILALTSQNRATIRATELFILEKREASHIKTLQLNLHSPIKTMMDQEYGPQILKQILLCIGSTMPRSYLSIITEMFRKFLSVHHLESVTWLAELLAVDNFPSPHIEVAAKKRFSSEFLNFFRVPNPDLTLMVLNCTYMKL